MTAFVVRRLAFACVTLFAVLTLVFVLVRIVPGDPAQLILGDQASREAIDALRHRLGLDLPLSEQYVVFLSGALRGDPPQPLRRLRRADLVAAGAFVPALRRGDHPAPRVRDRAAVVPGDQRA